MITKASDLVEQNGPRSDKETAALVALAWLAEERRIHHDTPAGCAHCTGIATPYAVTVAIGNAVVRVDISGNQRHDTTHNSWSLGGIEVEHCCNTCGHFQALTHSAPCCGPIRLWKETADGSEGQR